MSHSARFATLQPIRFVAVVAAVVLASCASGGDETLDVPGIDDVSQSTVPAPAPIEPTTTMAVATVPPTPTTAPPATTPPQTAAPTTAAPTTTVATTVPAPDGPYYRIGDEGSDIAIIQLKLQTVGFLAPGYTEGVFDSATNSAVLDFQGQYGLIVDGVVGPSTDRALTAAALSVDAETE